MTRARDDRPTSRVVRGWDGEYVVTLTARTIAVRPLRRRKALEQRTTPSALYDALVLQRISRGRPN